MEAETVSVEIIIPFPPSNNAYWRHPGNGVHLISAKGVIYRNLVWYIVKRDRKGVPPLAGPLDVKLVACRPNKRVRDLDNLPKAALDSLTKAGLWKDDSQIQKLSIEWGEDVKGGELRVYVDELKGGS